MDRDVIDAIDLFRSKAEYDAIRREERHAELVASLGEWIEWSYLNGHSTSEVVSLMLVTATNMAVDDCRPDEVQAAMIHAIQRLHKFI